MKKILTAVVMFGLLTNMAYGSGFQLNEQGARAMAMAGAFTGLANDPSAVYFNPAGITQLKGTQFLFGATLIAPASSFTGPTPSTAKKDMESQIFTPINFYITHQLSNDLSIGLGVNNQYGLGTKWDAAWVGRYFALETKITSFFFTPVIAYKLSDQFSVSAGVTFATATVLINRNTPLKDPVTGAAKPDGNINMEGDGTGWGFTLGILYQPSKQFQMGLSYRSQTKFTFDGTLKTTPATLNFTHPLAGPMSITLPAGNITAPLTTPQNITFGLAYLPSDMLTFTFDFQYVGWSSYDKLAVTANNFYFDPPTNKVTVSSADRNYKDSFIARLGTEYKLSDTFCLRGGLLYDKSPAEDNYVDPTLPDANRVGVNVGFGAKLSKNIGIDVAYFFLSFADRSVTASVIGFNGTYTSTAHLLGVNFSYNL